MHMQQVALAQDTAGFQGGGSSTGGSAQVTTPIPSVPPLPEGGYSDVTPISPGGNPPTGTPSTAPTIPKYPPATTTSTTTGGSLGDLLPLLTIGGLVITMIGGESIFKEHRKVAYLVGLGALYYELSRK